MPPHAAERSTMKKTFISIIAFLLIIAFSVTLFGSCSKNKQKGQESKGSEESTLESGALSGEEHFSPPTESDSIIFIEDEETDEPTETKTEKPTEKETEEITEKPAEPIQSLRYLSYGNGTCTVSGIGSCTDMCVVIPERSPAGDIVTSIDEKAFFENKEIKAVQIPSTVTSIGRMAFGGCTSLVYISVDRDNKAFTDVNGVLYSKDKTTLILFPSANQAPDISISVSVEEICDMAFYNCPSLKSIKYGGTLNDWSEMKIGENNYGLYSASISFAVTE